MWDGVAILAIWGSDMAQRPGQRASAKLGVVCREVSAMVEARTDEPLLVPLFWVGYFALALPEGEASHVLFGCIVPLSGGGGRSGEMQKFLAEGKW